MRTGLVAPVHPSTIRVPTTMQPQPYAETNQPMQVLSTQFIIVMILLAGAPLNHHGVFLPRAASERTRCEHSGAPHKSVKQAAQNPPRAGRHISLMPVKPD